MLAGHAATALAWEPVHCGAYAMHTDAEHAAAWRALAGYWEGPMRTVMLELAAYADGASVETAAEAEMLTAEDLRLTELAREAESRADFAEARRLLGTCRRPLDDGWMRDLDALLAWPRRQWMAVGAAAARADGVHGALLLPGGRTITVSPAGTGWRAKNGSDRARR